MLLGGDSACLPRGKGGGGESDGPDPRCVSPFLHDRTRSDDPAAHLLRSSSSSLKSKTRLLSAAWSVSPSLVPTIAPATDGLSTLTDEGRRGRAEAMPRVSRVRGARAPCAGLGGVIDRRFIPAR